jgi:hypothetical protein
MKASDHIEDMESLIYDLLNKNTVGTGIPSALGLDRDPHSPWTKRGTPSAGSTHELPDNRGPETSS